MLWKSLFTTQGKGLQNFLVTFAFLHTYLFGESLINSQKCVFLQQILLHL